MMKNIYFTAMLVFSLATVSMNAQEKAPDSNQKPLATVTAGDVNKQLNLTPEQEVRFNEIVKKYNTNVRDIQKRRYSKQDKVTKLEVLNQETEAEMKSLLKLEQYQAYVKLTAKHPSEKIDMRKKPVLGSAGSK